MQDEQYWCSLGTCSVFCGPPSTTLQPFLPRHHLCPRAFRYLLNTNGFLLDLPL